MGSRALDIHAPYRLTDEQIAACQRDGFIRLKNVLAPALLQHFGHEITRMVLELNRESAPLNERDTYGRAFLQVTNLWRHSERVKEFVLGRRLGRIAAELLGVGGVRIYHDQALYKEPGGGYTPWHADQYYWPLASDRCITAWIPLQATPQAMGPLSFAAGSHRLAVARDLPISDASEELIQQAIRDAGFHHDVAPYDAGAVSFHTGWTFHRAGPNTTDTPRRVMTIIYMDADMRLAEPANDNQVADREAFCPGIQVGEVIDSEINPVVVMPGDRSR